MPEVHVILKCGDRSIPQYTDILYITVHRYTVHSTQIHCPQFIDSPHLVIMTKTSKYLYQ